MKKDTRIFMFIEHRMKYLKVLFICVTVISLVGCKKLIEVDGPVTSLSSANIYDNDATATSVVTGIYTNLSLPGFQSGGLTSLSYLTGLSADELTLNKSNSDILLKSYYLNKLGSQLAGFEFWNNIYPTIYVTNSVIEGISSSKGLSESVRKQLLGEAKFMRAFCFFYLVNLYGDVPLVLNTDYKVNAQISRTNKELVWQQIVKDLEEAQDLLNVNYLDATLTKIVNERVRPTKGAATALLARAYLYNKDWQHAEKSSGELLNNSLYKLANIDDVFKMNNQEAIWQIPPVSNGINTQDAAAFIILPGGGLTSTPVYLSENLLNSFDAGDSRKTHWINNITLNEITYFYAYKYKIPTSGDPNALVFEYSTIFRLAEQYLIRAEARIQQNKIAEGIDDLNMIRSRATDRNSSPSAQLKILPKNLSKADALIAVKKERFCEFFTEWGHRWLDLKRTGDVDSVMEEEVPKKITGGSWKSYQQYYPLPVRDLLKDRNLIQNQGY